MTNYIDSLQELKNSFKTKSDKGNFEINPSMNKIIYSDKVTFSTCLEISASGDPNNDYITIMLGKTPYFNGNKTAAEQVEKYQFSVNGWIDKDLKALNSEQLSDIWIKRLKDFAN